MQTWDFIVISSKSKLNNQQRALTKAGGWEGGGGERAGHKLRENQLYTLLSVSLRTECSTTPLQYAKG